MTPEAIVKQYRPITELVPAHWQSATVAANGIRHHYLRTGGSKPPIVLLHGIMEGALSWLRTARALEADYDAILLDARGHGLSDRVGSAFSPELLIEDAAGIIRALGLGAVRLVGFSQGASTAIRLADAYPNLVHSLAAAGLADGSGQAAPSPTADAAQNPQYMAWFNGYVAWLEALKTQTHEERMVSALAQLMPGAPLLDEDDYVAWVENCARLDLAMFRASLALWAGIGQQAQAMEAALQRIACPTLLMKSGMFPVPGAPQTLREEPTDRPNVRAVVFENAGHLIYRERFDPFITLLREFLRED